MFRAILLAMLIAAPLSAGALMDQLHDGKKPNKVAQAWFNALPTWLTKLKDEGKNAESRFRDADGKLYMYCIDGADKSGIKARKYLVTGEAGKLASSETTVFKWEQWETPQIAAVYPVESNESAADIVAFACWLYEERKAPLVANRVLTVLHGRKGQEDLRQPIAEFICENERHKKGTELACFDMWDSEFRTFRTILVPAEEAAKFKQERERAAKLRHTELTNEYRKPETRTLTLAQLEYELKLWATTFGDTEAVKSTTEATSKLLSLIADDIVKVGVYVESGEKLEDASPLKAAEDFEKALALDPASRLVLSKAANARMQVVRPTLQGSKSRVVGNEGAVPAAMTLYERWLLLEPDNVKVMVSLGRLHHVKGEVDKARKHYLRVLELKLDAGATRDAAALKAAADKNPKNEDK